MCFPSGNSSQASAAAAQAQQRRLEDARQRKIGVGQQHIDRAFKQFDDGYYDKFQNTYTNYYTPQIADQYAKAQDKLTALLAGRGTLESSAGASKFADLQKTKSDAEAQIGNNAVDAANQLRQRVEGTKTDLYGINRSAGDPHAAAAQASGAAASIVAPQAFSPLGQVFASLLTPLANYNQGDATSFKPSLPWNQNGYNYAPLSGGGSSLFSKG